MERFAWRGASGAWRVHRWRLQCFSLELGDTEFHNDISAQGYEEWPHHAWVQSPIVWWLGEPFQPMLTHKPGVYPEPDQDESWREALLPEQERNGNSPQSTSHTKAVLFCPLPGLVRHLKCWLTNYFADHVDIFHMYKEMGNDAHKEMQLKYRDSPNPSVFVSTPKASRKSVNLGAASHAGISQRYWVLNVQRRPFAQAFQLGDKRMQHTWLRNPRLGGYDNPVCNLHQHSAVAQIRSCMAWWVDWTSQHQWFTTF